MCYEFSHWFDKARAREMHKARARQDAARRVAPAQQPREPQPVREVVKEPEKTPA
jgi:hypothetical protein